MTLPPNASPTELPAVVDQRGPNGVWRATESTDPALVFMVWEGGVDGPFDRLNPQLHETGVWQPGPGQSMSWIPNDPEPETEDLP